MKQLSGAFPTVPEGSAQPACLADVNSPVGGNGYTLGKQAIALVTAQPTIVKPWTVYAWGVQGYGALANNTIGGPMSYGRLGRLLASIMFGGTFLPQSNQPFLEPNSAATPNLQTLWDGSQDPPFPFYTNGNPTWPTTGFFQGSFTLPTPQHLAPGDQLAVGLWLTPALVNATETIIFGAQYTIFYEG